mgnify:CR=1 FL=1
MDADSGDAAPVLTVTPNPAIDKAVEAPGFAPGRHVRVKVLRTTPAGKGINVARGIVALGGGAEACGLIGTEEKSRFASLLEKEGICDRLVSVDGGTRTNTTILDPEAHTTTHLREEGFHVSRDDIQRLQAAVLGRVSSLSKPCVAFCGSLPPGLSPSAFVSMLDAVRQAGGRVVVDASGEALQEAVRSGAVDVLKPNLEELGQCLGRDVDAEAAPDAARELLDRVEHVLLTLGKGGAYHIAADRTVGGRCAVDREDLVNTVGAGDAFLAGWLYARSRGSGAEEALRWAVAAGSASVTGRGPVGYTAESVKQMQACYEEL